MQLPFSNILPIDRLSQCFNDTTNSYKFYWFLAILEAVTHSRENGNIVIEMKSLAAKMVSNVWYPLSYYKLSFGKQDGFKGIADEISSKMDIDNRPNSADLFKQIEGKLTTFEIEAINNKVLTLLDYAPYLFIRPFWQELLKGEKGYKVNEHIKQLANEAFENNTHQTIYRFIGKKKEEKIEVDEKWVNYFKDNHGIIQGFIYWHLVRFLQKHNPNVIGLSEKLFKPVERDLKRAKRFWRLYFSAHSSLQCIYSNTPIRSNISIDHFLPWSYVAHDELWNLLPTFKKVNSSKGNCLPNLNQYLGSFIHLQHKAFLTAYNSSMKEEDRKKLLEDYTFLFNKSIDQIAALPYTKFEQKIKDTLIPMHQIATNMGFSTNWTYQP
ncbi:MAG: HNH endonuclease domain-containing protein [Chitinophagales bacterium]